MHIDRALEIAVAAHRGQMKAGQPYILHPLRMMLAARGDDEMIVALLHDVPENSGWTVAALMDAGLGAAQAKALDGLTRRPGEGYDAFVDRAVATPLGRAVKLLDLRDNLAHAPDDAAHRDKRRRYRHTLDRLGVRP